MPCGKEFGVRHLESLKYLQLLLKKLHGKPRVGLRIVLLRPDQASVLVVFTRRWYGWRGKHSGLSQRVSNRKPKHPKPSATFSDAAFRSG